MGNHTPFREHIQFMYFCGKHSSNSKINFEKVARDLNIASKGAAAKCWERLLKSNDIDPKTGYFNFSQAKQQPEDSDDELAAATSTVSPSKRQSSSRSATLNGSPIQKRKKAFVSIAERLVAKMEDNGDKSDVETDEDKYPVEA